MVLLPGGVFSMGNAEGDADEKPPHKVSLSPFWIGEKEVTFAEWDSFFKAMDVPQTKAIQVDAVSRPTPQYIDLTWGMGRDGNHPANSMSQQAALMYCKWLYEKTGTFYRLPTEAEWEYACRAGSTTAYPAGTEPAKLSTAAYFAANSDKKFHKTGELKPNAWGLYDMLGNLSEWTLDQYLPDVYSNSAGSDPLYTPTTRYPRVTRGGSYQDEAKSVNCTARTASDANWNQRDPQIPKSRWWLTDAMFVGFRIVQPVKQPTAKDAAEFYAQYLK